MLKKHLQNIVEKELTSKPLDLWNAMKEEINNQNEKVINPTLKRLNDSKLTEIMHSLLTVIIAHEQYIEAYKSLADIYGAITHTMVSAAHMLSKRLKQIVSMGNENVTNANCEYKSSFDSCYFSNN